MEIWLIWGTLLTRMRMTVQTVDAGRWTTWNAISLRLSHSALVETLHLYYSCGTWWRMQIESTELHFKNTRTGVWPNGCKCDVYTEYVWAALSLSLILSERFCQNMWNRSKTLMFWALCWLGGGGGVLYGQLPLQFRALLNAVSVACAICSCNFNPFLTSINLKTDNMEHSAQCKCVIRFRTSSCY